MSTPMNKSQVIAGTIGVCAAALGLAGRARSTGHTAAAAGVLAGAAWFTAGAFAANTPIMGPVAATGPGDRPRAALTFDDGPGPSTPAVLEALQAAGVRATFFVLGAHAVRYPEIVRRIHEAGHQLASHGYDHGILVFRGVRHVRDQLSRTEAAINDAAGADAISPWFRAPHGFRGPATWIGVRSAGYRMAGWTAGVFDTAEPGVQTIVDRCDAALRPGTVVLLHDADGWRTGRARPQTAMALPGICEAARRRGIELVTFTDLLETA